MPVTPRRRVLSTVLALALAVESVSAVAVAASQNLARHAAGDASNAPAAGDPIHAPEALGLAQPGPAAISGGPAGRVPGPPRGAGIPDFLVVDRPVVESVAGATSAKAPAKAKPGKPARSSGVKAKASPAAPRHRGRNHVWIPGLRIDRTVHWFPCSRSREPDNLVYRWGCAGRNNVYLLGHAHSVFKGLHDAYVSGRLHAGMKAWYADARGRVRAYRVKWWRVVRPTTSASWAWAALSRPSMTLQTCVGRNSEYRLMVRLVATRR